MSASSSSPLSQPHLSLAATLIPPLSSDRHKGQAGRIGIVGGSRDYTGAPYFASMSSMRLGADLAYTVCSPDAASTIKTFSPDLIVMGLLDDRRSDQQVKAELEALMRRVHAVVVGPGLGRDEAMQGFGSMVVQLAKEQEKYIVIDADGLWLLQNRPELVRGYRRAVLTPNVVEFARLCKAYGVDADRDPETAARELARALDGPTVVEKGRLDRITDGEIYEDEVSANERRETVPRDKVLLYAGYAAAAVARLCSRSAFRQKGRAMLADDLLPFVGSSYEELFGDKVGREGEGEKGEEKHHI